MFTRGVVSQDTSRIIDILPSELESATIVLARAFHEDPLLSYVMGEHDGEGDPRVRKFFSFTCQIRLTLGWPLLGVEHSGELRAVMALTPPAADEWAPSLVESYKELLTLMGPEANARFDPYRTWVEAQRPRDPHYYLGIIGTSKADQGKGFGRMLLDRVHALSESDLLSTGVGLDTDSEDNVSLYQHFGYTITGHMVLGGLYTWAMFRTNST